MAIHFEMGVECPITNRLNAGNFFGRFFFLLVFRSAFCLICKKFIPIHEQMFGPMVEQYQENVLTWTSAYYS